MKNFTLFKSFFKPIIPLAIIIICLSACAKKINFAASPVVPAAQGKVKIKKDNNKNYEIEINIDNLAEPQKLTPRRGNYVVWMNSASNQPKNLGQLTTSSGFFSSALKASFKTVTPVKPIRIFITAEDVATPQTPGSQEVLSTPTFD